MRCSKCNAPCQEIKNDREHNIFCPDHHHELIQYHDGGQLEVFEVAELRDSYSSWLVKVINHTKFKKINRKMEKYYFAMVFLGPHFLFRAERLLPTGCHIFDLPEFNGVTFSKVLDLLDNCSLPQPNLAET